MASEGKSEAETRAKKHLNEDPGGFVYEPLGNVHEGKRLLMVGLSFSMTKYSDPCLYNFDIWEAIKADIEAVGGTPFVFVQWEIADAACGGSGFRLASDHVCEPHTITHEQVLQPRKVLSRIRGAGKRPNAPLGILTGKLQNLWSATGICLEELEAEKDDVNLRKRLAANLNGLLSDRDFCRDFYGKVFLDNLARPKPGRIWWEYHELPPSTHTVRQYQGRRLGVFILEALFGDGVLKPTEYITTRDVLDAMMIQAYQERFIPECIYIYAHEAHAPRVKWQLLERIWSSSGDTAWRADWLLRPEDVVIRGGTDRWGQPDSAQEWTDCKKNWDEYNQPPGH
jgi:hypothetical protein